MTRVAAQDGMHVADTAAMANPFGQQLAQLESAGLVRLAQSEPELEYSFRHALLQEAAYGLLVKPERQRLHLTVGDALEDLYPNRRDELAAVIGDHFRQAGDDRAARYLARAADRALATHANPEAESHYRAASELSRTESDRASLLGALGEAVVRQGRQDEAIRVWREAIELHRSLGDDDGTARLYARSARATWESGDVPGGLSLAREGLAAVRDRPETPGLAALLHEAARACFFNGLPAEAHALGRRALAVAERFAQVDVEAEALVTLGVLPGQPPDEVVSALARAVELAESFELLPTAVRAHNNLGLVLQAVRGDLRGSRDHFLRAAELARRAGVAWEELLSSSQATGVSIALGDLDEAERSLPALCQLIGEAGGGPNVAEFGLALNEALLPRYRGELEPAIRRLRDARTAMREQKNLHFLGFADNLLGEALIEAERWDEAQAVLLEAVAIGDQGLGLGSAAPRCSLSTLHALRGDTGEARRWLDEARTKAGPRPNALDEGRLASAEAQWAAAERRWPEAFAGFEAAARGQGRAGMRWARARTLQDWAEAHLRRGEPEDRARAEALLREALAEFERMGAFRYTAIVEDRLQSLARQRSL